MRAYYYDLGPALTISFIFFFNHTSTTEIYTLSLHDALPICIVGMLTRNENSVAAGRVAPRSSENKIVVPEREAPGKAAATSWPTPTAMAIDHVTRSLRGLPRSQRSTSKKQTPPTNRAMATGRMVSGSSNPIFFITSPPQPVMTNATSTLLK